MVRPTFPSPIVFSRGPVASLNGYCRFRSDSRGDDSSYQITRSRWIVKIFPHFLVGHRRSDDRNQGEIVGYCARAAGGS